jgi:predicted ester cyclase
MSMEENKAIVRRFTEAINEQDLDALDELCAPDVARRWKQEMIPWIYDTFVGHQVTITDLITEGDKVVARLATSGGHSGEWLGIPPTGKQWTNAGVTFCRLSNGKIVEESNLFDVLNHLTQLGATITPPELGGE